MPNTSTGAENSSAPKPITADSELIQIIFARLGELSEELDAANRRLTALEDNDTSPSIKLPAGAVRHNPSPGTIRPLTTREMRQARLQARIDRQVIATKQIGPDGRAVKKNSRKRKK